MAEAYSPIGDSPPTAHAARQHDRANDLKLLVLGSPASGSSAASPTSAVWIIAWSKSDPSAKATGSSPRYLPVSHTPVGLWCRMRLRTHVEGHRRRGHRDDDGADHPERGAPAGPARRGEGAGAAVPGWVSRIPPRHADLLSCPHQTPHPRPRHRRRAPSSPAPGNSSHHATAGKLGKWVSYLSPPEVMESADLRDGHNGAYVGALGGPIGNFACIGGHH